jgi:hypothetical protein
LFHRVVFATGADVTVIVGRSLSTPTISIVSVPLRRPLKILKKHPGHLDPNRGAHPAGPIAGRH